MEYLAGHQGPRQRVAISESFPGVPAAVASPGHLKCIYPPPSSTLSVLFSSHLPLSDTVLSALFSSLSVAGAGELLGEQPGRCCHPRAAF